MIFINLEWCHLALHPFLVFVALRPYIVFSRGHRSKFICYCFFRTKFLTSKQDRSTRIFKKQNFAIFRKCRHEKNVYDLMRRLNFWLSSLFPNQKHSIITVAFIFDWIQHSLHGIGVLKKITTAHWVFFFQNMKSVEQKRD